MKYWKQIRKGRFEERDRQSQESCVRDLSDPNELGYLRQVITPLRVSVSSSLQPTVRDDRQVHVNSKVCCSTLSFLCLILQFCLGIYGNIFIGKPQQSLQATFRILLPTSYRKRRGRNWGQFGKNNFTVRPAGKEPTKTGKPQE